MKLFLLLLLCRYFVGMSNFEFCASASCTKCIEGYFGDTCFSKCPDNCHDECNKTTGLCLSCRAGYFMDENKSCVNCPGNCTTCTSVSSCFACKNGYHGDYCQNLCSRCKPGTTCEKQTGFCRHNSSDGFSGDLCDKKCGSNCQTCNRQNENVCISCASNKYSTYCKENCSRHCVNNTCNDSNGECTFGCLNGFWGSTCDNNCSTNCKDYECIKSSGECSKGCIDSYEGAHCSTRIPQNQNQHITYVVIAGVVPVGVIFFLAIFLCKARRFKCCDVNELTFCENPCLCITEPQSDSRHEDRALLKTILEKKGGITKDNDGLFASPQDEKNDFISKYTSQSPSDGYSEVEEAKETKTKPKSVKDLFESYSVGQRVIVYTYSGENTTRQEWLPATITRISEELIQVNLGDETQRFVKKSPKNIRIVT